MDIIRKYYEPDLKKVMRIWYDGNIEAHDFIPVSYWDRNFGYVSRLIPRTEVYVYEIDGQVVGFVGVDDAQAKHLILTEQFFDHPIG